MDLHSISILDKQSLLIFRICSSRFHPQCSIVCMVFRFTSMISQILEGNNLFLFAVFRGYSLCLNAIQHNTFKYCIGDISFRFGKNITIDSCGRHTYQKIHSFIVDYLKYFNMKHVCLLLSDCISIYQKEH